jgi:hypothetical protein
MNKTTANDDKSDYSPDNWAHNALLQMNEVNELVVWASVSIPDVPKYNRASKAFWDVVKLLAAERERLEEELRKPKT